MSEPSRCPVCRAKFRGQAECSRCGADLARLMKITWEAWRRREEARAALLGGDFERARELAEKAQQQQRTESGAALESISRLLAR